MVIVIDRKKSLIFIIQGQWIEFFPPYSPVSKAALFYVLHFLCFLSILLNKLFKDKK